MDIREIVKATRVEFKGRKPTLTELTNFVATFGVAEALALASLLLAAWAYLFPRDPEKSPRCPFKRPLTGRACGAKIVEHKFIEEERKLLAICQHGHKTEKRTT